jgi:hypothetical protein
VHGYLAASAAATPPMKAPERVTLAGRFVRLEPLEERHRDDLMAAGAQDPATFRYLFTDLSQSASVWNNSWPMR